MTRAIRIYRCGGPEVLTLEEVEPGEPGPGQVRLRHTAVGVNFIDTYHRTGLYPLPLPSGLGLEAAGVVEAVGAGVSEVQVGQRVAYAGGEVGAYCERRCFPAERLVPLPDDISDLEAAAMLLKGMTAEYLVCRTFPVGPGHWVLVHAAAGGVGLLLCQWAKHLGATVIGTVSNEDKARLACESGCDHVIVYTRESFVERVRELTRGAGVAVVYDAVGQATWEGSLDCLAPRGMMVSFGNASGPVAPFTPLLLSAKGSLYLTRPTLMAYTATRQELLASAERLFQVVRSGAVRVTVSRTYPLAAAAEAHRYLESRQSTGSLVLLP